MRISYYFAKVMERIQIAAVRDSDIHKKARICGGSNILGCKLGRYTYIGKESTVAHCEIGSFCSISNNCTIGDGSHPTNWVTTSPVMYGGRNILKTNFSYRNYDPYQKTMIDHDVWIGSGCHIKAGVHLSTGCVIGMGSVVTKDVGPYEIWAGNPARLIKKRFDDKTIEELLKSEWWNLPDDKLQKLAPYFDRPELLIEKVKR